MRGDSIHVLLIEHDSVDAELMQKSMEESAGNLTVQHVHNLETASRYLSENHVDVLLLSLALRSGVSELASIRKNHPQLPIVVITTIEDTFVALKAVREGAQDYIVKGQTSRGLLNRTLRYAIERKKIEEALRYRLEFEKLITTISTHFINIPLDQIDRGINRALQAIGEFAGVQRCYLFQFSSDGLEMQNTHEWCAAGIESQMELRKDVKQRDLPWITEKLRRAETVQIQSVSQLPPEAGRERRIFQSAGMLSVICMPMIYSGDVMGFLGFDSTESEKSWSEDILSMLKVAGDMLTNALKRKQTQEDLQRNQKRLELFARSTNDVLWDWDMETNQIWWNENLQRVFGFNPNPNLNFHWWAQQIHPEDREPVLKKLGRVIQAGGTFAVLEYRFACADGSFAQVVERGYVLTDETGKPLRMIGAIIDVTDQERTRKLLQHAEDRYRMFFEDDLAARFVCAPDGRMRECNERFMQATGISSQDDLGSMNICRFFPDDESWQIFMSQVGPRQNGPLDLLFNGQPVSIMAEGQFSDSGELLELKGILKIKSDPHHTSTT